MKMPLFRRCKEERLTIYQCKIQLLSKERTPNSTSTSPSKLSVIGSLISVSKKRVLRNEHTVEKNQGDMGREITIVT